MTGKDRKYIDRLREADRKYYEAEITAVRRAVDIYNSSNNERWAGANEFRGQLKDQAGTFVTRRELWVVAIGIIGVIIAIVQLLIQFTQ